MLGSACEIQKIHPAGEGSMTSDSVVCDVCRERGANRAYTALHTCPRCNRTACEPTHWNKADGVCYFCAKVK
jgi:hypothetical protein